MSAVRTSPKAAADRLLVLRQRGALARLGGVGARGEPAAGEDRLRDAGGELPGGGRAAGEQVGERRALAAEEGGEADRRETSRARATRDARVGGGELALGLDQVGAAQQQLGGQARGHRRRPGHLVEGLRGSRPADSNTSLGVRPSSTASATSSRSRSRSSGGSCARTTAASASSWRSSNSEITPPCRRLRCSSSASSRSGHGAAREIDLLVERAQREVGLGHLRGEREAHRFARRLARLELGARRGGVPARRRPEEIELVGDVQRRRGGC